MSTRALCGNCGKEFLTYSEMRRHINEAHPTPQATKPVDELRAEILTEFKQVHKLAPADYTENCTNVVMSIIEHHTQALLTEARINELENWAYCGASKWEIDERIAELKGEAPTPTKEREEQ